MLKLIRALLFLVGVAVVVQLSIDNRQPVGISFWPLPYATTVPLYWVFLAALALGVVLGGLAVWASGHRARAELRQLRRRVRAVDNQERMRREEEERALVDEARRKTESLALAPPVAARSEVVALAPVAAPAVPARA
jgi:lipopolysaccharide assembly protein A